MNFRPICRTCHERLKRMRRVFCWLPMPVFDPHWPERRCGFRWLRYVLRDRDGKRYALDLL